MKAFSGYEETKVNNFEEREKIELGGHICRILEVKIESYKTKDGQEFEQLILKIDLDESDRQGGFYQRRFTEDAKEDALKAKWKGYFRVSIPKDDSPDTIKSAFKTFTTAVEHSNPGYKWQWEENTLTGKIFGGVFGLEEFTLLDGKTIAFARCRFARGTEKILDAKIPKVRLADGKTYIDYEEYKERKELQTEQEGKAMEENSDDTFNDDLPF